MASVYKASRKRPIPSGAEILRRDGKRYAVWVNRKTKRQQRALVSDDGQSIILEAKGYTVAWEGPDGRRRHEGTRIPDKDAAQQLANQRETEARRRREGLIDPTLERFAQEARRPLTEHVADFEKYLRNKQNTPKHVRTTAHHVRWLLEHCGARTVADLMGPPIMAAVGELRDSGGSLRTCNSYLTSIKAFSRWLWRHKRRPDDALCTLEGFNQETDRRHTRRELTPDEVARMVATAERRPLPGHCLSGADRAMVYRLALGTGFRAKELRSLTPESFELDGDTPAVIVAAGYSKHRREDRQPIRQDLADLLRPWLADKPQGQRLFARLPGDTARMVRSDMALAREAWIEEAGTDEGRTERGKSGFLVYENAAGEVADFHSTRHTYISGIVAGGASVKTAQVLARHSTPNLTIGRYAHTRLHDLQGALDTLPAATPAPEKKESEAQELRRTGTDDSPQTGLWGKDRTAVCTSPIAMEGREDITNLESVLTGEQKEERANGLGWLAVAKNPPHGSGGIKEGSAADDTPQTLSLSAHGEGQQPLAGVGEKRRRPDSNRGWRICNPLP